ncbi:MAG TPA: phage shock protein PspD [Arsenophonus sp.]
MAKIAIIVAIHFAPAGITKLMLKYISRQPLRWFMLRFIEPLLCVSIAKLMRNLLWKKYEKVVK